MSHTNIQSSDVRTTLARHILADGYDMVLDLEKSHGSYLIDKITKREYLDFFTFFASNPLGMNHPALVNDEFICRIGKAAINKPSNSDIYTEYMAEFMETFERVGIPDYLPHAFFISGGALAVENAMKVAFDWKVQKNFERGYREEKGHLVLHFEHAFHGRTGYTLSVTNTVPDKVKYFPKFNWPRVISPANHYPETEESVEDVEKHEHLAIEQAKRYFDIHKDEIACILIEPIQAEGGDRHFRQQFHKELRKLADIYEALLIYDEVQTGIGLTGKFWAHEHFVEPDIIAFGKKAQVCGILAGKRLDEVETNCFKVSSRINSTWGGNLVDMVRFQRILEVIERDNLVDNAANLGDYLLDGLHRLSAKYAHFSNPRGKGLMCAIDLPNAHARNAVVSECMEQGLMILGCGDKTIRFRPALTVSKTEIDQALKLLSSAYSSVTDRYPVATD